MKKNKIDQNTLEIIRSLFSKSDIENKFILKVSQKAFLKANDLTESHSYHSDKGAYQAKYESRKNLLKICNFINQKYKLKTFYLKSFRNYTFIDHNIDIVILLNINEYIEILKENKFRFHFNLADIREPLKTHYLHQDSSMLLHVHQQVSWNGIIVMDKDEVHERGITIEIDGENIRVPCYEHQFLIMAAHCLFENYYISLGELADMNHILKHPLNFEYIHDCAKRYHWDTGLKLYIKKLGMLFNHLGILQSQQLFQNKNAPPNRHILFPYYFNYMELVPIYINKLLKDIFKIPLNIPRQLFTYFLVGPFWQYLWRRFKANRL